MPDSITLAAAVVITWLVEWALIVGVERRVGVGQGLIVLLVNLATNPPAHLVLASTSLGFVAVELLVWIAEIPLLRLGLGLNWSAAVAISALANLATALIAVAWNQGIPQV